jgi:hypothetical protein
MTKKTYHGSCHCGTVAFEATIDFEKGTTRCNCSICTKARFWFAIVQADDFKIEKGEDQLSDYTWVPPGKSKANLHYRSVRLVVFAHLHRETKNHSVNSTQCLSPRWTISSRTPAKSPSR